MTQYEIIQMANEAGLNSYRIAPAEAVAVWERFAALVEANAAAKEREACAQVCDDIEAPWDCEYPLIFQSAVDAYAAAIRARSTT